MIRIPFRSIFTLRRALKDLARLAAANESIARSLARLADHVDPPFRPLSPADLAATTGVSFGRDGELAKIQDYQELVRRTLKREPTEEEIVDWLDGKEHRL